MICTKCSSKDTTTKYKRVGDADYKFNDIDNIDQFTSYSYDEEMGNETWTIIGEHLQCTCNNCGYKCLQNTHDKREQK